jgi:hypothetical protein
MKCKMPIVWTRSRLTLVRFTRRLYRYSSKTAPYSPSLVIDHVYKANVLASPRHSRKLQPSDRSKCEKICVRIIVAKKVWQRKLSSHYVAKEQVH